jgi:hypothetical protein
LIRKWWKPPAIRGVETSRVDIKFNFTETARFFSPNSINHI